MSKSPITEKVPDCKGVYLPYLPGFIYAAINPDESSLEASSAVFESGPDFMRDYVHVLDVSRRKVNRNFTKF
jgi:hypothetical protein